MTQPKEEKINVEINQIFEIKLQSMMGSTGYGWELSHLDGPLNLVGISVEATSATTIAPVIQKFTFRAVGAGDATVTMVKTRPWTAEPPIDEVTYHVTVEEAQSNKDDDLKLEGFVPPPQTNVGPGGGPTSLYAVYPPTPDYGITPDIWQRYYYGVLPPVNQACASDPRLYYGVCCQPEAQAPTTLDARLYYGVCCRPEDLLGSTGQVVKYGGMPPIYPPYGVYPVYSVPMQKYNIPPVMRYNYPSSDSSCC